MKSIINLTNILKKENKIGKKNHPGAILAILFGLLALGNLAMAASMGLHTSEQITRTTNSVMGGVEPFSTAQKTLLSQADYALTRTHNAKEVLLAYAFYNSTTAQADESLLNLGWLYFDTNYAYKLALAYKLTGNTAYADKAIYFLDNWATINKEYKGARFDRNADPDGTCNYKCAYWYDQTGADLYMTTNGVGFIQAAILLRDYPGFTQAMKDRFTSWVKNVYRRNSDTYLYDNPSDFDDNSGSWANFGVVLSHVWLQDTTALQADVDFMKSSIITQIASDGILTVEQTRDTKAMWYTYYTLAPMSAAAMVLYNETGTNLFNWVNPAGASITTALDLYFEQAVDPSLYPWQGSQGTMLPSPTGWGGNMFEALTYFLDRPEWKNWIGSAPITYFSSHMAWSVPTLLRNEKVSQKQEGAYIMIEGLLK